MFLKKFVVFIFLLCFISAGAQDAPSPVLQLQAEDMGNNKIRLSWTNPYNEGCIQLMVQRSNDSLKNFRTIFSTESPQLPANGFIDVIPYTTKWYYRIFYILQGNAFYFTPSKQPSAYIAVVKEKAEPEEEEAKNETPHTEPLPEKKKEPLPMYNIRTKDSLVASLLYKDYKRFRDSLKYKTKDTLYILSQYEILLKKFDSSTIWWPSVYVITNDEGYIKINLPDAGVKKYRLVFFDTSGKKLFTLQHITEPELVLDKTNFLHSGWFNFELYEDDKLKEKNKILLQKEF